MDNVPVDKAGLALVIVAFSLLFVALWPLGVIWSVNTLFRTDIPYNIGTWAATLILVTIFRVSSLYPEKR